MLACSNISPSKPKKPMFTGSGAMAHSSRQPSFRQTSLPKGKWSVSDQPGRAGVAASTQNQAFNALLFFYREVLSRSWGRSTRCAPSNQETPVTVLLRTRCSDCSPRSLSQPSTINPLLPVVPSINHQPSTILQHQLALAKAVAQHDRVQRYPVALPGLLAKKYPWTAFSERWGWLFPSHSLCRDPRTQQLVRWRCHENNVQRAVRAAARKCHLEGLARG